MTTAPSPSLELALAGGSPSAPPAILNLCLICGERPRAGRGALTRCINCIKDSAERDRQDRIAAEAKFLAKAQAEGITKRCRTCRQERPLDQFFRHRLGAHGRRANCIPCIRADRVKRKERTEAQKARTKALAQQPHRKAQNLEAVIRWQHQNPAAVRAARLLDADVRHGKIVPAMVCEAERCDGTGRLSGHHNSYSRRRVAWLCPSCHRRCHSGIPIRLKSTAALRIARAPKTA